VERSSRGLVRFTDQDLSSRSWATPVLCIPRSAGFTGDVVPRRACHTGSYASPITPPPRSSMPYHSKLTFASLSSKRVYAGNLPVERSEGSFPGHHKKKIQPPPPYAKGSRPCGSTKFSAKMLNRSLMAAPRCARARCAGANALAGSSVTRNHCAIPLLIEWVPGKIHGPVVACPAKAASQTAQHSLNLTLKSEDSPPQHLPFCCPSCLFGNTGGRSVDRSLGFGRPLCANCRRIPLDRV
jgi:hypothetical protein